ERTVYAARIDEVRGAATPWRKVADVEEAVTNLDLRGDTAYVVTHKDAPRFQIVTIDLAHPQKKPAVLVPASQVVVTNLGVAEDGQDRRHQARATLPRGLLGHRVGRSQGEERRRHDRAALDRIQERHCIRRIAPDLAGGIWRLRNHARPLLRSHAPGVARARRR